MHSLPGFQSSSLYSFFIPSFSPSLRLCLSLLSCPALVWNLSISWQYAEHYKYLILFTKKRGGERKGKEGREGKGAERRGGEKGIPSWARAAGLKSPLSSGHVDYKLQNGKEPGNPKASTAGIHKAPPLWFGERHLNSRPIAPAFLVHHMERVINRYLKADIVLPSLILYHNFTNYFSRKFPSDGPYRKRLNSSICF